MIGPHCSLGVFPHLNVARTARWTVMGHLTQCLAVLSASAIVALLPVSLAHSQVQGDLKPKFFFNDPNGTVTLYGDTADQVFQALKQVRDYCTSGGSGSTCYTLLNLHPASAPEPYDIIQDGVPYWYYYDQQICTYASDGSSTGCNTSHDWGGIQSNYTCPQNFSSQFLSDSGFTHPRIEVLACLPNSTPASPYHPAPDCKSCIGDPIFGANGQVLQVDVDYPAVVPGLSHSRTYRSNNGPPASVASAAFIDYSQAAGTGTTSCYPSYWTNPGGTKVAYCFPYMATGAQSYQLNTDDGRFVQFSGPNGAVTQSADINERIQQISFSGATAWQVNREDGSVEVYSASGLLLQKTLRGGEVITYTYSTSSTPASVAPFAGLLLTQSDPFGHTLSWQYNSAGQPTQMTDPAGGVYQYSYDSLANLTSVTYPGGSSKSYLYNESAYTGGNNLPNAMTGVIDESNTRFTTLTYSQYWGFATGTQEAGGANSYTIPGYSPGSYAAVNDPLGTRHVYSFTNVLSYARDASERVYTPDFSSSMTRTWARDANGNVSQYTDFNGNVTTYSYDLTRNLEISRTEASGTANARTITTTWSASYRLPTLIAVYAGGTATGTPLRTTAFTYDSGGNLLSKTITDTTVTPNVSRTWSYTYDSYGRMLTAKGPRTEVNSTTTYSYYTCTTGYRCGQLHTATDPVGNLTTYNTYNAHGQPLTITDPNGVLTTLTYDARLRLTSRQVGSETTAFSYYSTGLLKRVTLPDGSYVQYAYDGAHRLTQISDGAGNSIQYTLDAMGNRTAEKAYDPSNTLHRTHSRAFNYLNQLYQDVNAANTTAVTTTYGYDNNGNQTSVAAPVSRNRSNTYDALNRLTQITDPANGITKFSYDANDSLASVQDPKSLATSYAYNSFGDIIQQISPDTGTSTSSYDSGGNLNVAKDARGSTANYSYDVANRVTQIVYKNSGGATDQTIVFGYDAGTNGKGRLTSASDANHSLSWSYDVLGRVTGKGLTVGSVNLSMGYGYTNGDPTALVTASGQNVVYSYNSNHQVTGISVNGTTVLSGVTYEPFAGVTGWAWGNSTSTSRSFNGDGLISQIVTVGVTLGYSYDNANRITGISDSSNSTLSWTYGYDSLDRLTSAASTNATYGWTYDADGNRLTQTGTNATTFSVASTSNQLTGISGSLSRSYSYDAAGNTQSYGPYAFYYNNRGRMMATNASSTNYLYNALGQVIEKSGTTGTTIYMYDEFGHALGEYDGSGHLIQETIWLGEIPVATLQPNGSGGVNIFYVHTDHLNSPRKISRPSDSLLVWRWDADPFGTAAPNQNPSSLGTFPYNLRFPGQYYQAETGLNPNYFRDYDPQVGRYLESDPIGVVGGLNTYLYVGANPISLVDPLGLCECEPGKKKYSSQTTAARAILRTTNPESILRGVEFCGSVCRDRDTGKYFTTGPVRGTYRTCSRALVPCPDCSTWVATFHTHGAPSPGAENFSQQDMVWSDDHHVDNYLATPSGQFLHYPAGTGVPYSLGPLQ